MTPFQYSLTFVLLGLVAMMRGEIIKSSSSSSRQPTVAFHCKKAAIHLNMDDGEWIQDAETPCLKVASDVLNYCKKVYPDLEITNIIESETPIEIDNWCSHGRQRCRQHRDNKVQAYHCLVGAFQSDALLVPDHCVFDHIHRDDECVKKHEWEEISKDSCAKRGMLQRSYAILLPCGLDVFGGVEFVCCPEKQGDEVDQMLSEVMESREVEDPDLNENRSPESDEDEDEEDEDDYYEDDDYTYSDEDYSDEDEDFYDEEEVDDEEEDPTRKPSISIKVETLPPIKEKPSLPPLDAYTDYLKNPKKVNNEHGLFTKAKTELQKHHHEKVTKMMKEWAGARQHVQDMKDQDPKAADKLNREVTARFQKTYEALEQEGMAEKKQLVALHQQRVQSELNEKKRHAMELYMNALQKSGSDAASILKALKHYIKAEQKDRMHSVNHWKHLSDTDLEEATGVKQQVMDHLSIITQRVEQAVNMLDRVPSFKDKIIAQIDAYQRTFQEIDNSIENLMKSTPAPKPVPMYKMKAPVIVDVVVAKTDEPVQQQQQRPLMSSHRYEEDEGRREGDEEEDDEDPETYVEIKPAPIANMNSDQLHMNDVSYIKKQAMSAPVAPAVGSTFGVAVGCIAVFVLAVVGLVFLRRKASRVPVNHGFIEVDQATSSSPEERHVANMQINGYENPTYKYFEVNTSGGATNA